MRCIFRTFFLTIVRFLVLLVSLVGLAYIEVSPLPEWTLVIFAYMVHVALTWFFAAWAFRKYYPSWITVGIVTAIFILGGTALETALYFILAPRASLSGLWQSYTWHSLALVTVYIAAIVFAGWRARLKNAPKLPEGVVI